MPKQNDFGDPLSRDGAKFAKQLKYSREAIRKQGGRVYANVPPTLQWVCANCGHTNLNRALICGSCDEPRQERQSA